MTMTGSVKLKLKEVDGGIEGRHNCYVCVSCGTLYGLEELGPIRIRDLFARVPPEDLWPSSCWTSARSIPSARSAVA